MHVSGNFIKGAFDFSKAQYGTVSQMISDVVKTFAENSAFIEWLTLMYDFLAFGNEEPDEEDEDEDMNTDEGEDDDE
jgi:hypothetical protein